MTMTGGNNSPPHLAPFRESKSNRDAQQRRTDRLLSLSRNRSTSAKNNNTNIQAPVQIRLDDDGGTYNVRPLTRKEISTLEGAECRCKCDDWSTVLVVVMIGNNDGGGDSGGGDKFSGGGNLCTELKEQICDTTFAGWILLGISVSDSASGNSTTAAASLKHGIRRNALVSNCILEAGCTVQDNTVVDHTHVCQGASIVNCGSITVASDIDDNNTRSSNFADEMEITLGAESGGGREVKVHVESTLVDVCHKLGMGSQSTSSSHFHYNHYKPTKLTMNVLCPNSNIRHTPTIANVYLSSNSRIEAATSVKNAILLPDSKITNACTVESSYLQWRANITTNSSASSTILMECAAIGPNSFVSNTVLGPDSHLSTGECHHSLLGPNTNSHHQSLLISVLWPLGRGNIGYGSNVGSNHTGRLPDQEVCAGEGTFWGLGCVVKMPVNLCESPYSIVAAGVQLPPQRLGMPFSLILSGSESEGGGLNQILPGWVIQSSPYTIARSEVKFANRRKAKQHGWYTGWDIIRSATVDMCLLARDELIRAGNTSSSGQASGQLAVEASRDKVYKTEKSITGLGQNYVTDSGRLKGIQAYTTVIQRYALRGLLLKVEAALEMCHKSFGDDVAPHELERRLEGIISPHRRENCFPGRSDSADVAVWPSLPWNESSERHVLWNHQRCILKKEIPSILKQTEVDVSAAKLVMHLLERLVNLERDYAHRVYKSKRRDDARGSSTIPGYKSSHVSAEDDAVVKAALEESHRVERSVKEIYFALSGCKDIASRL